MSNMSNILSRVFTQNTFMSFIDPDNSLDLFNTIIRRYNIEINNDYSYLDMFNSVYAIMDNSYRNEYLYKNLLLNKFIINVHRLNTTKALTEIPIANSKADLIMINGKAVVYEIKTELDNLERLDNQINDYYKAFDHVCVVSSEDKKDELLYRYKDSAVGIYILTKKDTFQHIKEPEEYRGQLCVDQLFQILRKKEYEHIVKKVNGYLPEVTPVYYYEECRNIINGHSIDEIYPLFLNELKKRKEIRYEDFENLSAAFNCLVYFSGLNGRDIKRIKAVINNQRVREGQ